MSDYVPGIYNRDGGNSRYSIGVMLVLKFPGFQFSMFDIIPSIGRCGLQTYVSLQYNTLQWSPLNGQQSMSASPQLVKQSVTDCCTHCSCPAELVVLRKIVCINQACSTLIRPVLVVDAMPFNSTATAADTAVSLGC